METGKVITRFLGVDRSQEEMLLVSLAEVDNKIAEVTRLAGSPNFRAAIRLVDRLSLLRRFQKLVERLPAGVAAEVGITPDWFEATKDRFVRKFIAEKSALAAR